MDEAEDEDEGEEGGSSSRYSPIPSIVATLLSSIWLNGSVDSCSSTHLEHRGDSFKSILLEGDREEATFAIIALISKRKLMGSVPWIITSIRVIWIF